MPTSLFRENKHKLCGQTCQVTQQLSWHGLKSLKIVQERMPIKRLKNLYCIGWNVQQLLLHFKMNRIVKH